MTRWEWKLKQIHMPINFRFFEPALKVLNTVFIITFALWYINRTIQPFYHLEQYTLAKELKRQEEHIKESQVKELAAAKYIVEQTELKEKYKKEDEQRKKHAAEIEACAKKYKIGDRIKIYDMNAPMVPEGDHFRYSIGAIDVITNIIDTTLYCESGESYCANDQIDKVRSNREWKDLVNMSLRGELQFAADNIDAP